MSSPLTLLITKSDLVGVVPQFTANVDTNHFAAARKFANERFKNLVPSALYEAVIEVYALTAWSNAATYASGDKVVLSDRGYEANQSTSAGQSPLTHPAKWDEIEMYSVWRDYIKPFLCWQAYAKFLPFHGTFVAQGGMKQHVDLSSEPVPADKLGIAIQNAQSTADGYYMDFQKYLSDNANTIDSVAYVFTGTTTFRPKIGIRMIKTILLFLLPLVAEAQYYPLPIVHEPKNYHFQKKVYVDQKLKIGDPGDPVINRKLHVVADTIRFEGLDGTGTYLTIDANGDVIRGLVVPAGVTGLSDQQIVYGKADGSLDQEADFFYDEDINTVYLTDETATGQIILNDYDVNYSYLGIGFLTITNSSFTTSIEPTGISFSHGPDDIIFNRQAGGSDYTLYWPNADGSSGQFLRTDGSGNLDWATAGTVTSIATTSPITGGTITGTGTIGINNASADGSTKGAASFTANDFDASSGNISIDYTNAQKASASVPGFVSTTAQDIAGSKTFQNDIAFEGATADGNETTITATDPTADATVTLQNVTGTLPVVVASTNLTGQNAGISATTIYTAPADGFYQVTVQLAVTTTGGTSIGCQIKFTNAADNVVKTMPSNNTNGVNQCLSSTTANAVCYTIICYAKSGTDIQYVTNLSGSGQVYSLDAVVQKLK